MNQEERQLLEKTIKISEDNSRVLKYLQRAERIKRVTSIFKWVVIILLTVGSYYALAPYLDQFLQLYSTVNSNVGRFDALGQQLPNIGKILQGLNLPR